MLGNNNNTSNIFFFYYLYTDQDKCTTVLIICNPVKDVLYHCFVIYVFVIGLVYSIPCNDCEKEYLGQSKRQFCARLKEH